MPTTAKPVLILLHGATLNASAWRAARRHLSTQFQILAPDFPGHGSRRGEAFTFAAAVDTVCACAAGVGGAPLLLVGDSLGGYVAQAAAPLISRPQLKGLVLGGSTAVLDGINYLPYLSAVWMFKVFIGLFGEERLAGSLIRNSFERQGIHRNDIDALKATGLNVRMFAPAVAGIRGFDALENLSRIQVPLLFVNGSRDSGMVRGEPRFLERAPLARAQRFEGCGHGVSMLRSAEFAALVNQFAADVFEQ